MATATIVEERPTTHSVSVSTGNRLHVNYTYNERDIYLHVEKGDVWIHVPNPKGLYEALGIALKAMTP